MKRTIKEMEVAEVDLMLNYFLQADDDFLRGMGADPAKLPSFDDWRALVVADLGRPLPEKQFYYLIWLADDAPVGHSNINKIVYAREAYMHLHLWMPDKRRRGNGSYFVRACIDRYFEVFQLETLYCEPYAMNQAPNRTLERLGFKLVEQYVGTPGWINFEQPLNRWLMTKEQWLGQTRQP